MEFIFRIWCYVIICIVVCGIISDLWIVFYDFSIGSFSNFIVLRCGIFKNKMYVIGIG